MTTPAPALAQTSPALDLPPGVPSLNSFYLYVSTGCNLACRHCWITPRFVRGRPSAGEVIDLELLRQAVTEAKPLGLRHVSLTGGEPLLHPRFVEIVDLLGQEGLDLSLETNGTLLTPALAAHIVTNTRIANISISLDGADVATHDGFRSVPGAFFAAQRAMDYLAQAGFSRLQVIMSVHHGNRPQIEAVAALAAAHGAFSFKLNPVIRAGRGKGMHERGEGLDFQAHLELANWVYGDFQKRAPLKVLLEMPPALCSLDAFRQQIIQTGCGIEHNLGILGSGEFALCGIGRSVPELTFGRLGQDRVRDVWLHNPTLLALRPALQDFRRYPGVCADCIHAVQCRTGCVANNYLESGVLLSPIGLCSQAERLGLFPATRRRSARAQ